MPIRVHSRFLAALHDHRGVGSDAGTQTDIRARTQPQAALPPRSCRPGRLRPLPAPAPAGSPSPTESRPGGTTGSGPAENYFFPQTMTWDLSLEAHPLGPLSPSMQSWHQPLPRGPVAATGAKLLDPQSSGVDRREPQATPVSSRASGFPTLGLEDRILPR